MKPESAVDLAKLALMAGAAYMGWKVYGRMRDFGQDIGGAIGSTVYDFLHPTQTGPDRDTFKVIGGNVYHVIERPGAPLTFTVYNFATRKFQAPPAGYRLPDNWRSAPYVVPRFADERLAGRPWYYPWDGTHAGLQAALVQMTSSEQFMQSQFMQQVQNTWWWPFD